MTAAKNLKVAFIGTGIMGAPIAGHIMDAGYDVTVYNRTKEIMGVSPNSYIQNERLTLAAQMIVKGEQTIAEISERVGFVTATYFYRCFKSKYGVPPSKYGK